MLAFHGATRGLLILQHERPLSAWRAAVGPLGAHERKGLGPVLAMIVKSEVVEADLAAGLLCCPSCETPLTRWGFAREREIRTRDEIRLIRPRRARCVRCETTHVLLPAWVVPRRRDSAEVIGAALLDKANGLGHRRIAKRLARPPGTVRGWLRTFASRADQVSTSAWRWTRWFDPSDPGRNHWSGSPTHEAVDALGCMARACRLRLRLSATPWELAVSLTGLLYGRPRDPPGY